MGDNPKQSTEGIRAQLELPKQIITLSTAAIAFTVTFLEKFTSGADGQIVAPWQIFACWGLFLLAIIASLWTIMSLNGTLTAIDYQANGWKSPKGHERAYEAAASGDTGHSKLPGLLMLLAFVLALIMLGWAGTRALDPTAPIASTATVTRPAL